MEGFTYTNIFETKGIEYIIIICFLLMLIPFWLFINRKPIVKQLFNTVQTLTAGILRIPQGIFFSKNHTWVHLEKIGEAKTGIDDFLYRVVGDVKIKTLKTPGESIKKGEMMAEIIAGEKRLNILSPVSGEITKTNNLNTDNQKITNEDLYENAWFYSIKPANWKEETSEFYLAEEASEWIRNELHRLKDFLNVSLARYSTEPSPAVLQEGGELSINPLAGMQREVWDDFQKEFLG